MREWTGVVVVGGLGWWWLVDWGGGRGNSVYIKCYCKNVVFNILSLNILSLLEEVIVNYL